jgi:predicted aspartyl protease
MNIRSCFRFSLLMMLAFVFGFPMAGFVATDKKNPPAFEIEQFAISGVPVCDFLGNVIGVTIPLKRAGRLFLLEATVDKVTGNFILDTGASGLVLNKTYFRNAICVDDEEAGGVTGAISQICRTTVKHMQVAEVVYRNMSADVIPLGHLENRRGVKILGLFGMSLLKNLEFVVDFRNNELQLFKLDKYGNRLGTNLPKVKYDLVQKIEEYRNVLFVKATVGGKILDFCLDTGAESNVLSIDAPKKALNTVTITSRSSLNGAGAAEGEVLYGTLNDFVIGSKQINPMGTILCNLTAMSRKYAYPIDGMLGYDFFAKGKICINLVKNEMGVCLKEEGKP